jgi:hypothetical protein
MWGRLEYREAAEELLGVCRQRDMGVMAIKAVAHRPWNDGRSMGDSERWATSWYEPARTPDDIERGVRFALSTPGVHGFCTPGDIGMLPAVLDAAEGYAALSDEQRQAAVDAMATGELIFPMPG